MLPIVATSLQAPLILEFVVLLLFPLMMAPLIVVELARSQHQSIHHYTLLTTRENKVHIVVASLGKIQNKDDTKVLFRT